MSDANKKSEQELELELKQESIEYVMATKLGRFFVYSLLVESGVFTSSANQASFRTNETFFYEGQRNIGNRVLKKLELFAPDAYLTMIKENKGE